MSPFLIIAQQDNSINPTSFLGWMDAYGILIREIINDVQTLEWNKNLIFNWQWSMETHGDYEAHTSQKFYATWHPPLATSNPWEA